MVSGLCRTGCRTDFRSETIMSEKKITIDVKPDGRIRKEAFMIPPMVCPYCGGKGWFYSGKKEPETIPCPDCEGTGEVVAMVTIDWKPNIK